MPRKKPANWTAEQWSAYLGRRKRRQLRAAARAEAARPWPKKMQVDVGAMTATVKAGPDEILGTADDKTTIKPKAARKVAAFNQKMTKAELLGVAQKMKLKVSKDDTKAVILAALRAASK